MDYYKLFLTFTKPESLEYILGRISEEYTIPNKKIWVLKSDDTTDLLLTYNVGHGQRVTLKNTVSVHRQRKTHTIYSVNGINLLTESLIGKHDPHYRIDWEQYKHKYIGAQGGVLKIMHTHLQEVVEF